MECPHCNIHFHPQMYNIFLGQNSKRKRVWLYYQLCPECKDPVVGYREQRITEPFLAVSLDTEGLTILSKNGQKNKSRK